MILSSSVTAGTVTYFGPNTMLDQRIAICETKINYLEINQTVVLDKLDALIKSVERLTVLMDNLKETIGGRHN